ncbi:MAG: hypothetical protein ACRDY5_07685, partial [Acidimicrobiales bacterium]
MVNPDTAGRALCAALAARASDGVALAGRLRAGFRPRGLDAAEREAFDAVAARWQAWLAAAHPTPGPSC